MDLMTRKWFSKWVSRFNELAKKDEMYNLGIFRKEDDVNVGKVELSRILRMDYQWAMMGYSIHNQYWRNGYAFESVSAAAAAFFDILKYHRIELHIYPDNIPSIRLAEKAGFQFECARRSFNMDRGEWKDMLIYYMVHK